MFIPMSSGIRVRSPVTVRAVALVFVPHVIVSPKVWSPGFPNFVTCTPLSNSPPNTYVPCTPSTIFTHSKFSQIAMAPLAVPVTAATTAAAASSPPPPADADPAFPPPYPMATPHVKVSAIAFSADENTEGLVDGENVSFDAGARSASEEVSAAVTVASSAGGQLLPTFPRRDDRFGRRVQKTT